MKLETFYSGCSTYEICNKMSGQNGRMELLYATIDKVILSLVRRDGQESKHIEQLSYDSCSKEFEFSYLQYEAEKLDKFCLTRFVNWLNKTFSDAKLVSIERIQEKLPEPINFDGKQVTHVSCNPHLLIISEERVEVMFIYYSKHGFSPKARNMHNKLQNYLPFILAKKKLDPVYPGIKTSFVSLKRENDRIGTDFLINNTGNSNYQLLDFEELGNTAEEDLEVQLTSLLKSTPAKNCYTCRYSGICKKTTGFVTEEKVSNHYQLPKLTKEQETVVHTIDSPVLMDAGPGSGKTATLVARTIYMVERGIDPENILLITYTNTAVDELVDRLSYHMPAGRMPKVCTFHALSGEILKNAGINTCILTEIAQKELVYNLLSVSPKMSDFSYELIEGDCGLVCNVVKRINHLKKCVTPDQMEEFERKYSPSENFKEFYASYIRIVASRRFITFEEQIERAVSVLSQNPDLLNLYNSIYKYVMADEAQDMDEMQYQLVKLLGRHKKICLAGDGDQSIFGFRNGSSVYMSIFCEEFSAKYSPLTTNFRSSSEIVNFSAQVLEPLKNVRIEKNLNSPLKTGVMPHLSGKKGVVAVVEEVLKKGYSYGDICVISQTNSTVLRNHTQLSAKGIPSYQAKHLLVEDALYQTLYGILGIHYHGFKNEHIYRIVNAFGVDLEILKDYIAIDNRNINVYSELLKSLNLPCVSEYDKYEHMNETEEFLPTMFAFLSAALKKADNEGTAVDFVEYIAENLGVENAVPFKSIVEIATAEETLRKFYEKLDFMYRFCDKTLLENQEKGKVALYTAHSSKGKEFPVVIIADTEAYKLNADDLRLAYVSMTRAKSELYMLCQSDSNCPLYSVLKKKEE